MYEVYYFIKSVFIGRSGHFLPVRKTFDSREASVTAKCLYKRFSYFEPVHQVI